MKNIIIIFLAILTIGCNNKASDKINNQTNDSNQPNTEVETNSNTSDPQEIIFNDGKQPKIEFDMKVWEFGEINEGESVDTIFKFKNVGNAPLIISNAKAGCGCTVPKWPKDPIAPGENGEIQVKFNSKGKPGTTNKNVTLTMNTTPNTMQLRLVGKVIPTTKE